MYSFLFFVVVYAFFPSSDIQVLAFSSSPLQVSRHTRDSVRRNRLRESSWRHNNNNNDGLQRQLATMAFPAAEGGHFGKSHEETACRQRNPRAASKIPLLFNSLSRQREKFIPADPRRVLFYSCGPTMYDYAHIGNFRAFLVYDLLKRWLLYLGYGVDHVCNLTDVDDKIIKRMKALRSSNISQVTEPFIAAFFEDLKKLNVLPARLYPRASEHIEDMDRNIKQLVDTNYAYVANDHSVYFRTGSSRSAAGGGVYPKLVPPNFQTATEIGSRGVNDHCMKEAQEDFVLWKSDYEPPPHSAAAAAASADFTGMDDSDVAKVEEAKAPLVSWNSSHFGPGRPGWHIECSTMCLKHLGPHIDIHAGGEDLRFPHHANEIAQSEALVSGANLIGGEDNDGERVNASSEDKAGDKKHKMLSKKKGGEQDERQQYDNNNNNHKPFSSYWVHNGFVKMGSQKMSKSMHNIRTLKDLAGKNMQLARAYRFFVVRAHYRKPLVYSDRELESCKHTLQRMDRAIAALQRIVALPPSTPSPKTRSSGEETVCTPVAAAAAAVSTKRNIDLPQQERNHHQQQQQQIDYNEGVDTDDDTLESKVLSMVNRSLCGFDVAMCSDMNTPVAVAHMLQLLNNGQDILTKALLAHRRVVGSSSSPPLAAPAQDDSASTAQRYSTLAGLILQAVYEMDSVLGLLYSPLQSEVTNPFECTSFPGSLSSAAAASSSSSSATSSSSSCISTAVPDDVRLVAEKRASLKRAGRFSEADTLRSRIESMGYTVTDTPATGTATTAEGYGYELHTL